VVSVSDARVLAFIIAGTGAIIDIRTRRIPNALTFGAAAVSFLFSFWTGGWHAFGLSLAGWAIGVGLFLPIYVLGGMGAGDVKLLGAVGAWLGPFGAIRSGLFSVLAGGLLALVVSIRHRYLGTAFRNLWDLLLFWRVAGVRPLPGLSIQESRGPKLAYGVAIAAGTAVAVFFP
jgi:prepilin peptidase CpaA